MLNPRRNGPADLLALLMRFGLAGAVNTGVGFAIIEALDIGFHVPSAIANACGYAIGFGIGFLLNRGFVFRSSGPGVLPRYLVAVAAAFALNQAVLAGLRLAAGDAPLARTLAQLAGMAVYTATTFVSCRYWVFAAAPNKTISRSQAK
jgi:putative flippase GtrA